MSQGFPSTSAGPRVEQEEEEEEEEEEEDEDEDEDKKKEKPVAFAKKCKSREFFKNYLIELFLLTI